MSADISAKESGVTNTLFPVSKPIRENGKYSARPAQCSLCPLKVKWEKLGERLHHLKTKHKKDFESKMNDLDLQDEITKAKTPKAMSNFIAKGLEATKPKNHNILRPPSKAERQQYLIDRAYESVYRMVLD